MKWLTPGFDPMKEALKLAANSDVVIFVGGISPDLEGEEMTTKFEGFSGGDRTNLELPAVQKNLLKKLYASGKPVVLVLLNGSALSVNWENENLPAILEAWYPGEEGGTAIADVLFGDYNPSGRLPVTFYKSVKDLPSFDDYNMKGRTYRYFDGKVLYPFGHGLSYTKFKYGLPGITRSVISPSDSTEVKFKISNTGTRPGEEVVKLYIKDIESSVERTIMSLRGFKRIMLNPGESRTVTFSIKPEDLAYYDPGKKADIVESGSFDILIGPSSAKLQKVRLEVRKDK